jgi:hypothetical protein
MRKVILLVMATVYFTSCQESKPRYYSSSAEIDVIKAVVDDYENGNWDEWMSHYSDTAKIFHNSTEGVSREVNLRGLKNTVDFIDSYNYTNQEMFYEMITDDENQIWVYFWGTWVGTLSETGVTLEVPVHIASLMIDGKVVEEYGYYDTHEIQEAVKELVMDEVEMEMEVEEEMGE